MPILDPFTAAAGVIAQAILSAAADLIETNNLVEMADPTQKNPYPLRTNPNDSDFPSVTIRQSNGSDSFFSEKPTFAVVADTFKPDGSTDWQETIKQTYMIRIIGPDQREAPVNAILAASLVGLRQLGPRLGLPYVGSVEPIKWQHGEADGAIVGDRLRHLCDVQISVAFLLQGWEAVSENL